MRLTFSANWILCATQKEPYARKFLAIAPNKTINDGSKNTTEMITLYKFDVTP